MVNFTEIFSKAAFSLFASKMEDYEKVTQILLYLELSHLRDKDFVTLSGG